MENDTDFHFCWYADLYPLSFFPLKMTKLCIRHNQCFTWMTMITVKAVSLRIIPFHKYVVSSLKDHLTEITGTCNNFCLLLFCMCNDVNYT